MPPLTLKKAINTLRCVKHLGYAGQLTWALIGVEKPPTKDWLTDLDILAGADICFEVAKYLRFWLEAEASCKMKSTIAPVEETLKRRDTIELTFWRDRPPGVYYVSLNTNIEGHSFVLVLTLEEAIYAGGYGGKGEFVLNTFSREEWQHYFNEAMIGHTILGYQKAFCLSEEDMSAWLSGTPFPSCVLEDITVEKSGRYK